MLRTVFLSTAFLVACAADAAGRSVKGPQVAVEAVGPAAVRPDADGPEPDLTLTRQRYEMNLLAPIPLPLAGGMFVLKVDSFREDRKLGGRDAPAAPDERETSPGVTGVGAIYLPHAKEGVPRFFLIAERYGAFAFEDEVPPMAEWIVGADVADVDMPFQLKLDPTDRTETRLLVRLRSFPGFHRWLFLVGHRIERQSGVFLDVQIPSHLLAGYGLPGAAWGVYGGVKWASREYPAIEGGRGGWFEGHTTSLFGGARVRVLDPIYVALEAGALQESLAFYDLKGDESGAHTTAFAPFARLALETWIRTP